MIFLLIPAYIMAGYATICGVAYFLTEESDRMPVPLMLLMIAAWPLLMFMGLCACIIVLASDLLPAVKRLLQRRLAAVGYILGAPIRFVRFLESANTGLTGTTPQQAQQVSPLVVYRVTTGEEKALLQAEYRHWAQQGSSWCWCGEDHSWDTARPLASLSV